MKALNQRAMLVDFTIHVWAGRHKDNEVSEETALAKGADKDAGAWWTRALPKTYFKAIRVATSQGRTTHLKMTLPWNDSGTRILPAAMFLDYTKAMRKAETAFNKAVDQFLKDYPEATTQAQKKLGRLYRKERYPQVREIRKRFAWDVTVFPLPSSKDFRVDLNEEDAQEVKDQIDSAVQAKLADATKDLWGRMHRAVSHVVDRLSKKKNVFRDSLIGNVKELADVMAQLNVTGDAELEKMRKEMLDKLGKRKPQEIRNNPTERRDTRKVAKEIAAKMASYMNGNDEE